MMVCVFTPEALQLFDDMCKDAYEAALILKDPLKVILQKVEEKFPPDPVEEEAVAKKAISKGVFEDDNALVRIQRISERWACVTHRETVGDTHDLTATDMRQLIFGLTWKLYK